MAEDDGFSRRRGYRKKSCGPKPDRPDMAFPRYATITAKNIVYLSIHLGKQPGEIVAAYPGRVSLAEIHLALAHYYQDREAMDAEFARGRSFLAKDALSDGSCSLPSVGPRSPLETP